MLFRSLVHDPVAVPLEHRHQALDPVQGRPVLGRRQQGDDPTVVEGTREQRLASYRQVRDYLAARLRERFPVPPG